jgi:cell wall-associated NlpC family hydrolase
MTKREQIVAEARRWLRTPWHHRQRCLGAGVDCVMLLCEVYEACGVIPHVEPEYYPIDIMFHRGGEPVIAWMERLADEVEKPEVGDVVIYKFGHSFSHAGIVIGDGQIIHAFRTYGQVVQSSIDEGDLAGRARRYFSMGRGR